MLDGISFISILCFYFGEGITSTCVCMYKEALIFQIFMCELLGSSIIQHSDSFAQKCNIVEGFQFMSASSVQEHYTSI